MSSRVFQSVIVQMKEATDRVIGVIDADSNVISCSDTSLIGEKWPEAVIKLNSAPDSVVVVDKKTFKPLVSWSAYFDYAVFAEGDDETARSLCVMAYVALNGAKTYYEEKHDKTSFVKSILSDNILLSDIYVRAKELHVEAELNRGVFVIRRTDEKADAVPVETVQNIFPDRQTSFVLSMGEDDVVLVQQLGDNVEMSDLEKTAAQIEETLRVNGESTVVVGIGTVATHLRDLAKSYKEAQMAIEVGKVFDTEKYIISYENLGIGRLIYQLPTTLCEMFLQEVFKKNPIDALDKETLFTINKFFENNLILSETARKLFVHRNTLVYRLEKIKKLTGLDLREFDDAITFKVALMVKKYLASRGIEA
jgi:carbohydrate diacid regulator